MNTDTAHTTPPVEGFAGANLFEAARLAALSSAREVEALLEHARAGAPLLQSGVGSAVSADMSRVIRLIEGVGMACRQTRESLDTRLDAEQQRIEARRQNPTAARARDVERIARLMLAAEANGSALTLDEIAREGWPAGQILDLVPDAQARAREISEGEAA